MPNLSRCCAKSLPCRFDWQPAASVAGALLLLGLLGMLALILSQWPRPALNASASVVGLLAALQALQWRRRAGLSFVIDRYHGLASCNGVALADLAVIQRCGLLVLRWRSNAGLQQCVFLPRQLSAAAISELHQWPRAPAPFHKGNGSGTIA